MTLARKIVLGVGLAVLIPGLVYQGIQLVKPRPVVSQFSLLSGRQPVLTAEEALRTRAQQRQLEEKRKADEKKWAGTYFWVAVPLGIAVTVLGSLIPVQGLSAGFMLGGSFTFLNGYAAYLNELGRLGNFLVLLAAFAALLWIGLKGFADLQRPKQDAA